MSNDKRPDFDDLWDFDLWDYNNPAASEATFRTLLPSVEAKGSPPQLGELLTQIARTQGLQRKFAEAHATLDRVETMLPAARLRTRVRYLLERGRVWNSSGSPEHARPYFHEAWELAREHEAERYYAVDAAHMLAIVGTPEEQIEWNQRGVDMAQVSDDRRVQWWCAAIYNNLGWTYTDLGQHEQALAAFEQALEWWRERGTGREIRVGRWNVGRALRKLGRYDEALALQRELLAEWEASVEQQDGFVFEELGECLLALGRADESRPYFAEAYRLLATDAWLREGEPERLARLQQLGTDSTTKNAGGK